MISDAKNSVGLTSVTAAYDYFPGGMLADHITDGYRYGFNGKELDTEGMGGGRATYDYGFRIYNPQLGKFLSVDPLSQSFPWYTPYQFAGNKPIWAIDLDGLEEYIVTVWYKNDRYYGTTIRKINQEEVNRKQELQPFGPTGAYYIKRNLSSNINNVEELKAYQNNPANWSRVLRGATKGATKNTYYSEELASPDKGLLKVQNPGNSSQTISHVVFGEKDLGFDFNSDVLSNENKALLNNYAYFAANLEGLQISLEGFASTEGSSDYNKELSAKRVASVKNYLTEKILQYNPNADPSQILQTGSGAGETDAFGEKANNRRVTIDIKAPAKNFENHSSENEY